MFPSTQLTQTMSTILGVKSVLPGKAIFSGIQPTGVFHLGNFLGAIKSWVDLSRSAPENSPILFMIADLHAITVARSPEKLRKQRWEALASIIASGIDPKRCTVYFQSDVPAHAQLHWILSSISSMGYLNRMVQWKSKANLDESASLTNSDLTNLNLALFSYPTLQAADVLIHQAGYVPVGEDQSQHLELTRHLAQAFNFRFGETFTIPATVLSPHKKILSLRDSTKKMSKSDPDQTSCVYVTDTAEEIKTKLKRALTDSVQGEITWDPEQRPAVANLLSIAAGLQDMEAPDFLAKHPMKNHKELKDTVADCLIESLSPIREEYNRLVSDQAYLESLANHGRDIAHERTSGTLEKAYRAVGYL